MRFPGRNKHKLQIDRSLAIVLSIAAGLMFLVFGTIVWIESEAGQRFIERRASAATGREITIGDLELKIGWRPGFRARQLRIGNPPWARTRYLIDSEFIDAR